MPVLVAGGRSRIVTSGNQVWAQSAGENSRPPAANNYHGLNDTNPLPSGYGQIVANANVLVGYIGNGQYTATKNGGTNGSYDADAVSTATISGDVEIIIDHAAGKYAAGLNGSDPVPSSGYPPGTAILVSAPDLVVALIDRFGTSQGSTGIDNYAKLTYTAADDTYRAYTSPDRVNWTQFASKVGSGGATSHYFDSSLNTSGASFNAIFRTPPAILIAASTTFALTGAAATFALTRKLTAAATTYSLTGTAANLKRGLLLTAAGSTFALNGTAASLKVGRRVGAASTTFAINGTAAALKAARKLTASATTCALSGTAATLRRGYSLTAASGAFALSGTAAGLTAQRKLTAAGAGFTLAGAAATLRRALVLSAGSGTYTLTGTNAALTYSGGISHYTMPATAGSYTLTPSAAALLVGLKLSAGSGAFQLVLNDASLTATRDLGAYLRNRRKRRKVSDYGMILRG